MSQSACRFAMRHSGEWVVTGGENLPTESTNNGISGLGITHDGG